MAKLYFRHGTMGSAKTLNLLAVAHNYEQQQKPVFLMKPALDDRYTEEAIQSRAGLKQRAHLLLYPDTRVTEALPEGELACILVDEAQFLSSYVIEQLRDIASFRGVPVICYGLRSNFFGELFEGAKRLFELADSIEEIKTTCHYCDRKATMNLKITPTEPTEMGGIKIGAEETFLPACYPCFRQRSADFKPTKAPQAAVAPEEAS